MNSKSRKNIDALIKLNQIFPILLSRSEGSQPCKLGRVNNFISVLQIFHLLIGRVGLCEHTVLTVCESLMLRHHFEIAMSTIGQTFKMPQIQRVRFSSIFHIDLNLLDIWSPSNKSRVFSTMLFTLWYQCGKQWLKLGGLVVVYINCSNICMVNHETSNQKAV